MRPFPPNDDTTSKKHIAGCIVGLLLFMATMFIVIDALMSVFVEDTWFVSGNPRTFDPIRALPEVHAHAGQTTQLVSIKASFVRSDGTLDLKASYVPAPHVVYIFSKELSHPPENAAPLGAGATSADRWYEETKVRVYRPWQSMGVTSYGKWGRVQYAYHNLGMERDVSAPQGHPIGKIAPDPTCSLKELWDIALQHGAPKDAVAVITYDADGYSFEIAQTNVALQFTQTCKLAPNQQ